MQSAEEKHLKDKKIQFIPLEKLLLDGENPRFAEFVDDDTTQQDIVDTIVQNFGVDDVLSSIACSGYFSAEPLVCKKSPEFEDKYIVIEGNRRLSAMLIIANDSRAKNHQVRVKKAQELHDAHDNPIFSPVPCVVFDDADGNKALMSYLGVRHIVSTKEWDSFAKAAWIAKALKESQLSLNEIAEMIGDSRNTIKRMLTGYHFIKQLESSGRFVPDNSVRKGRGSNIKYPFSWVYTMLGNPSARKFTGLSDDPENSAPIPEEKLDNAALLVKAMFGNSAEGFNPAIDDSRKISNLAEVVSSADKVIYLKQGKNVEEIERLTTPIAELLTDSMVRIRDELREITGRLEEDDVQLSTTNDLSRIARAIKRHAEKLSKQIENAYDLED